jgi:hypothetical protein
MVDFHSPPATTRVNVRFLNLAYQRNIPRRVPSIKPTPDNWFNVMESSDPADAVEDDHLEYQQTLQVSPPLNDSNPEVGQRCQKTVSPAAIGEIVQWQGACGDAVVKLLPLCIFSGTNPTIKMGSIVEMDCIAKESEELPIRSGEPLQSWVCLVELCFHEGAGQRVPMHASHKAASKRGVSLWCNSGRGRSCIIWRDHISNGPSSLPTYVSHCTMGGIRVGVGNGWGSCRNDGSWDECPGMATSAGTTGAAVHETAVLGLAAKAAAVPAVSTTTREGRGPRARKATPLVVLPACVEPRARWATPLVIPPAKKTPVASCPAFTGCMATAAGGWPSRGAVLIHPTAATSCRPASAFPRQKRG